MSVCLSLCLSLPKFSPDRQPTLRIDDLFLEVITVHGNE